MMHRMTFGWWASGVTYPFGIFSPIHCMISINQTRKRYPVQRQEGMIPHHRSGYLRQAHITYHVTPLRVDRLG